VVPDPLTVEAWRTALVGALRAYGRNALEATERAMPELFAAFVMAEPDCLWRTCRPGHLTASAWIVDGTRRRVLLTHHRKLDRWLQLGGHVDGDPDLRGAALREAHEELGVPPDTVTIWGMLSPLYIPPSNFQITPVVGMIDHAPVLRPNDAEVSAVISVTVRELLDPALVVEEQWTLRGAEVRVPFFAIAGHKVWGATAIVLSEFVARMRRVVSKEFKVKS